MRGIITHYDQWKELNLQTHAADAFKSEDDINRIVQYSLNTKQYGKVALFIFGINTGYHCGDMLAFRVKDFYVNKKFRDILYIQENMTEKSRPVYINRTVQTVIEFVIRQKELNENNYVFRGDGNKKAYIVDYLYNSEGKIEDVLTTGKKYDENGNEREVAPMTVGYITKWLKKTSSELGIVGHFSSNAMRKTFAEFISRDCEYDPELTTINAHFYNYDSQCFIEELVRRRWLNLNLGLEPLEQYIKRLNTLV